jgi:hypothetical protein
MTDLSPAPVLLFTGTHALLMSIAALDVERSLAYDLGDADEVKALDAKIDHYIAAFSRADQGEP